MAGRGFRYIEQDSLAARRIDLGTGWCWFRNTILIFERSPIISPIIYTQLDTKDTV